MLHPARFGEELRRRGYDFYSGVPCSHLGGFINYAINNVDYIAAVSEADAVAVAAGAWLGGRKPVVLMQNSGLTNAVSPLTSLNHVFGVPVLGFVSLRGEPGIPDEPQHELLGSITGDLLDLLRVPWEYLSPDLDEASLQLRRADEAFGSGQAFFFVVRKGTIAEEPLVRPAAAVARTTEMARKTRGDRPPSRYEALEVINSLKEAGTVQLATTGMTGRELCAIEDAPNNLYVVGSMGCVSSLGLGLAQVRPDRDVVVVDGDGSLLMRLGNLAAIGHCAPPRLLHILLDNNAYDSTGGQSTVADSVDFVQVAGACGYGFSAHVHDLEDLGNRIRQWQRDRRLTFLYLKIARGSRPGIGRPSLKPRQVKERLMRFIHG